jgi:hypothetical protein
LNENKRKSGKQTERTDFRVLPQAFPIPHAIFLICQGLVRFDAQMKEKESEGGT